MAIESIELTRKDTLLLAIDVPVKTGGTKSSVSYQRGYFLGSGADCLDGDAGRFIKITPGALSSGPAARLIRGGGGDDGIAVVLYPTKTYAEGAADALFADVAPEDRAMIRRITRLRSHRLRCYRVPLREATLFDRLPGYLGDGAQRREYSAERDRLGAVDETAGAKQGRFPVGLDLSYLKNIVHISNRVT